MTTTEILKRFLSSTATTKTRYDISLIYKKLLLSVVESQRGKKRVDTKQRKLLPFFLMLACGSAAFLHLWQYTAHCHIRPALCRGQIAILLQDEVSSELIIFPQSLRQKNGETGKTPLYELLHLCTRSSAAPTAVSSSVTARNLPSVNQSTSSDFQDSWLHTLNKEWMETHTESCSIAAHWPRCTT